MIVEAIDSRAAAELVIAEHYLHRRPPISFAFALKQESKILGVCTFGTPPSRHLQMSACPSDPSKVIELNRLWVDDACPKNTETWFVSRCLALMPPRIVVSYADTREGHVGYIYRAGNWNYSGITDAERKTPRFDYVPTNGKHSRDAFRSNDFVRVRRQPKHKYWLTTGNRRERHDLGKLCGWPKMAWKQ